MDNYIPQPRPRLTDEAAAQVLDFPYEFIADFESAYAAQIMRHRRHQAPHRLDRATRPAYDEHNDDPF